MSSYSCICKRHKQGHTRSRNYAHYHRIYKVLQEIYENNRIYNRFISLKISDSSPRFQIPIGILKDLCWIPVGVGPLDYTQALPPFTSVSSWPLLFYSQGVFGSDEFLVILCYVHLIHHYQYQYLYQYRQYICTDK